MRRSRSIVKGASRESIIANSRDTLVLVNDSSVVAIVELRDLCIKHIYWNRLDEGDVMREQCVSPNTSFARLRTRTVCEQEASPKQERRLSYTTKFQALKSGKSRPTTSEAAAWKTYSATWSERKSSQGKGEGPLPAAPCEAQPDSGHPSKNDKSL